MNKSHSSPLKKNQNTRQKVFPFIMKEFICTFMKYKHFLLALLQSLPNCLSCSLAPCFLFYGFIGMTF